MRALAIFLIALITYSSSVSASKCFTAADVYFDPGSHDIPAEQQQGINGAIERARQDNTVLAVLPVGHSDSFEVPEEKQFQLSLDRAKAVAEYVVSTYPELKDVVYPEGKGAKQPLSNTNVSLNRRVSMEVICVVKGPFAFPKR
ncbi:MAG: OmpA family protein [Azonexus sp.]